MSCQERYSIDDSPLRIILQVPMQIYQNQSWILCDCVFEGITQWDYCYHARIASSILDGTVWPSAQSSHQKFCWWKDENHPLNPSEDWRKKADEDKVQEYRWVMASKPSHEYKYQWWCTSTKPTLPAQFTGDYQSNCVNAVFFKSIRNRVLSWIDLRKLTRSDHLSLQDIISHLLTMESLNGWSLVYEISCSCLFLRFLKVTQSYLQNLVRTWICQWPLCMNKLDNWHVCMFLFTRQLLVYWNSQSRNFSWIQKKPMVFVWLRRMKVKVNCWTHDNL